MTRKQIRSTQHTRGQMKPDLLEVPLPEDAEELPAPEPLPERRVPYTMHIVSQYPDHKHLPSEGATTKFIQNKIVGALENMESMIKHVEVRLLVLEHFHRARIA